MFHLLFEIGLLPFINMDSLSFTWYLVAAESRISKQSGVQDALQNSELKFNGDFKICNTEDDGCTVETCLEN